MSTNQKPKKVVHSSQLEQYKLNKGLMGKLERFIEMRRYMQLGGKPCPPVIRLFRRDVHEIDTLVSAQSDKKFSVATVTYAGLPIIAHGESPAAFGLEAA